MKIALLGYGKMGQTIESLAKKKGHEITGKIDVDTSDEERLEILSKADAAIEFSHPNAAFENIIQAISSGTPTVSGTTGWLDHLNKVYDKVSDLNGTFFYASNFSIGVNLFFAMNEKLASLMDSYPEYKVGIREVHHIHKKDAPSGTAITTAEGIIQNRSDKSSYTMDHPPAIGEVSIESVREGEVFGIHTVNYTSPIDTIQLHHEAHTRDGFAAGAIMAAEWVQGKTGVFGMKDMLGL